MIKHQPSRAAYPMVCATQRSFGSISTAVRCRQTVACPPSADIFGKRSGQVRRDLVEVSFWDKASALRSSAKQRFQTSAPPKPHGRRWCRTTTAALPIADHYCVVFRVALTTATLSAFRGQRTPISRASMRRAHRPPFSPSRCAERPIVWRGRSRRKGTGAGPRRPSAADILRRCAGV